jgi:hypothetical protein
MRFNDIASLNEKINALRLKNFVTLKSDQVDITSSISTMNDGKLLWKYCIILVLLFLALETLLLKFWKQ